MKNLFVDTNVIIDFLADRKPFSAAAEALFEKAVSSTTTLFVSSVSYNNIYYIVKRNKTHQETIELLSQLSQIVEIAPVTRNVIQQALLSTFSDFEDAIQYFSAVELHNINAIVTRDPKGFQNSLLPIWDCNQALNWLQSQ